ncbi:hypothetical protein [Beijerinckia sp. L45]|uniref:hypothetical protein n=1 Tax=Beijerinckia sp. L45 TaxID=1641855 RepID=UPI00131D4D5B|nr:hypothetical protein [Beijerinckia sp. L45]
MREDANRPRTRPTWLPIGCWPAEMRAETAAGYVDEPSVNSFMVKVERGIYCQPVRMTGCLPKWNREKLDTDLRRRHNLMAVGGEVVEDISDLI